MMTLALILTSAPDPAGADQKPYFLVANPEMGDPVFRHSVILMVPSTELPLVAGVIINEPTGTAAREVFPNLPALKKQPLTAYFGGPVDNGTPTLLVRGSQPSGNTSLLFEDVYVSTDRDSIAGIVGDATHTNDIRIFLGRAQWLRDQLYAEILEGAWYTAPARADQVFSPDPESLWHSLAQRSQLQEVRFDEVDLAPSTLLIEPPDLDRYLTR